MLKPMSADEQRKELRNQYKEVAAQAGDLFFRMEALRAQSAELQKRMDDLRTQRDDLQRKISEVKDDVVVPEPQA